MAMNAVDFDAVVVGSGFGGSVSAFRLAEAGKRVCVLERGKAYAPGDFPRSPYDFSRAFWDPSEGQFGLYNVWSFDGLGSIVSSGLGGGSLIYANVLLRKDEDTFVQDEHERWPVTRTTLDSHYAEVERMLNAQPYPFSDEPYSRTPKTHAMRAARDGIAARRPEVEWLLPKLAVTFANAGEKPRLGAEIRDVPPSAHGKLHPRLTCLLTGECDLGCNYGSKNTLDLTYLAEAKQLGAELRPLCEVKEIEPLPGGGYRVRYIEYSDPPEDGGRTTGSLTAKVLVVAAGAFGSTFLLLRNARRFPALDRAALGTRFSSNGDLLTFLVKASEQGGGPRVLEASYGPVITSAIRVPRGDVVRGHYIEDAGYPYLVSWLAQLATGSAARELFKHRLEGWRDRLIGRDADTDLGAELARILGDVALSSSSMPLLGMGRDFPSGRLFIDDDKLDASVDLEQWETFFDELERTAGEIAEELGGTYRDSRIRHLTKLVTVHPLGGCPMGGSEQPRVVDDFGEVPGYNGLFVADGSVMPGPVGPNPSLTIAALADRFSERMISRC